jgi:hypothetical protein
MPVTLATWEAEMGRIMVLDQPRQKVLETSSQQKKSWLWWYMPAMPDTVGSLK